jgi:spermidine synthase
MTDEARTTGEEEAGAGDGWRIRLAAFAGGGVLMGLQVSGSRFLSPHFGSSLYVWGALITTFLAALAAGYAVGGRLADKHPRLPVLGFVTGGAGLFVLLVPHLSEPVCQAVRSAGPRWGPLLAALLLFTAPAFLLAMVSPFCLRILARDLARAGRTAGTLYALSTVGSLAGTFAATFVLIHLFTTPQAMFFFGLVLLVVGGGMMRVREPSLWVYAASGAALSVLLLSAPRPDIRLSEDPSEASDVIDEVESPYHRIFVVEGEDLYYGHQSARYLQFDHYKESGILLEEPFNSATRFTDLFHLLFLFRPRPAKVLFVGGGGMIGPRMFARHYPSLEQIDVVEMDPEVVRIAAKHFRFEPGGAVRVHVLDGRVFVRQSTETYDAVVLDIFSAGGRIPFHLTTVEFFRTVRDRLGPKGVCVMNVISAVEGKKAKTFQGIRKVFRRVFAQTYAFPRLAHRIQSLEDFDRHHSRNVFLVGTVSEERVPGKVLGERAREYTRSGIIPALFEIDWHGRNLLPPDDPPPDPQVPLLTDEFNPLELWKFW